MKRILIFVVLSIFCILSFAGQGTVKEEKKKKEKKIEESIVVTCDLKRDTVFEANKSVNYIDASLLKLISPSSMSVVFNSLAGVTFSSTGNSSIRPVVRGLYDERVLVMVNGIRQEEQFGGGNHTYSIAPEFINSVSVIKGATSVTLGSDAIGGAVNIFFNGYGEDRFPENFFSVKYKTVSNGKEQHLFYGDKKGDLSFYFEELTKDFGNIETADGVLKNSYAKGYYFNSGINYEKRQVKLRLNYYCMQADLGIPVNPDAIDMGFKNNEYKKVQGEFTYKPFGIHWTNFTFLFANQFKHRHMYIELPYNENANSVSEIYLNKTSKNIRLFADFIYSRNFVTLGMDAFDENAHSKTAKGVKSISDGLYSGDFYPGVIPPSERKGFGIFLRNEYEGLPKFKFSFGARYNQIKASSMQLSDYPYSGVSENDKSTDFSAGITYKINSSSIVYLNAGTSFRSPSLLERFFYGVHQDSVNIGNPYLKPERGKDLDSGYRYRGEKTEFSIGIFRTVVDNFIELAKTGEIDSESGLEIWKWQNLTKVLLKGGEAEFHYHFKDGFSFRTNVSYVIARDVYSKEYLYEIPPVILNNIFEYREERNGFNCVFRFEAHTEFRQDRVGLNESPTPGFTVYNLFFQGKRGSFSFNFSITNITDKSYHRHLSRVHYMNDGEGRGFSFGITRRF